MKFTSSRPCEKFSTVFASTPKVSMFASMKHVIDAAIMNIPPKLDADEQDGEDAHKLMKMEVVNSALEKKLKDTAAQLGAVLKRLDHLEKQPAMRKGILFNPAEISHEAQPGTAPVETSDPYNLDALRLSPEEQRRISRTL